LFFFLSIWRHEIAFSTVGPAIVSANCHAGPIRAGVFSMAAPGLTPEQLAQLPHDDRGPAMLAAHWGLTALATVFLALRVYCKRITGLSLWWDDWILIAAWVGVPLPLPTLFSTPLSSETNCRR
jgi:hypothetical protein